MATDEAISDYEGFDFAALWKGRDKVTAVEREVLREAFAGADGRRILEVGTGFGRLTQTLLELGREVVATDFDLETLARLGNPGDGGLRVAANLYHLPFVDGAFTAASMVRIYHHIADPRAALGELARVLRGGSRLVVSYNPTPTVGTLVNDIRRALRPHAGATFRSVTFSRAPVRVPPEPFPVFAVPRQSTLATFRSAGFEARDEIGSGLEEYPGIDRAPAALFVRLGRALASAPGFPMRFALLTSVAAPSGPLPQTSDILACPRCRAPWPAPSSDRAVACARCGFEGHYTSGVLDLRYVPQGTPRFRTGTSSNAPG